MIDKIQSQVLRQYLRPGVPEKIALAAGAVTLLLTARAVHRYERWKRIEGKLDRLNETGDSRG